MGTESDRLTRIETKLDNVIDVLGNGHGGFISDTRSQIQQLEVRMSNQETVARTKVEVTGRLILLITALSSLSGVVVTLLLVKR